MQERVTIPPVYKLKIKTTKNPKNNSNYEWCEWEFKQQVWKKPCEEAFEC
jgi:hypothetical protein